MLVAADARSFSTDDERFQHCAFCGKDLVVLPNDRRGGACFDCLVLTGPEPAACAECGAEYPQPRLDHGCPNCGAVAGPG